MAFKNLIAFGAGELTPELYERGNLDKFRTGLARLRNAIVTKMGGLRSRAGSRLVFSPKSNNSAKYLYIQARNYLLELWRHIGPETDVPAGDIGRGAARTRAARRTSAR